ncbi:MAG: hypothetical protein FWC11_00860 [Firmicutes bacterium]|nr:hypothetical protein [Bacillota bacterium]MCL2255392.1 hypothetical protein [Bacillota bacterium]
MKKAKVAIIFVFAMMFTFALIGCGINVSRFEGNISEKRVNVFVGEIEGLKVQAITGQKEEPFLLDGTATGMQDFTLITIEPSEFLGTVEFSYRVKIGENEFSGEFVPHPFGKTYSTNIDMVSNVKTITLFVQRGEGEEREVVLTSVLTEDMIDYYKALSIAANRLDKQINSLTTNGVLNAEIYVRLMANPIDNTGGFFWYVAFLTPEGNLYAVLIDPVSMEVVAVRD